MSALISLALFEIRYHLRQPATVLYALLLFGQGIWLGVATNGELNPYILLTGTGPIVMLVASVLAGQALTRDLEHKTAAYLYTLPVPDTIWFTGKFIGTYLTVLLLTLFYPVGLAVAAYFHHTPVPVGELADGFVKIVTQNVLLVVSAGYALTVFTRRMTGAYAAMFALGLYALLTQSYRDVVAGSDLLKLLDPFGIGIVTEAVERAGGLTPDLSETWLISRLLWLGLTLGLLSRAEARFSFGWFAARPSGKPDAPEPVPSLSSGRLASIPATSRASPYRIVVQLTTLTVSELAGQVAFRLTLLALILATVGYALFYGQPDYLTESLLPTTARMTALRQPLGLFIGLFLMVWTGELAFRERTTGFWVIYDTLPQPTYLTALAKLLAMMSVALLLTLVLVGVGLGLQLLDGQTPIEGALYTSDLLVDGLFRYWQLIALALFISILTGNRFVAHAASVGLLLFFTFAPQLTWFDNPAWQYSFLPGSSAYSDLTGYGRFAEVRPLFHGLWWGVATCLLILTIRNWPRGVFRPTSERLRVWSSNVTRSYVLGLLAGVCWIMGFGYFIGRTGYAAEQLGRTENLPIKPDTYQTRTSQITLSSGRRLPVQLVFHHPYNADLFYHALQAGLRYGEQIFGPFPYPRLRLTETPAPENLISSTPGQLRIAEQFGWTASRGTAIRGTAIRGTAIRAARRSGAANRRDAVNDDISYIYYLTVREVLKQWIPNGLKLADTAGVGFLRNGLAGYLAAQTLRQRYGTDKLTRQINQYKTAYARGHSSDPKQPAVLYATADYSNRDEAPILLSRIGQAWRDDSLISTIGRFYRTAITRPTPATATDFDRQLAHDLPDSLHYLTSYLHNRYQFSLRIGQISQLPQGLFADVICQKWVEDPALTSPDRTVTMADYIPIVMRDAEGHELYRKQVLLGTGHQDNPVRLPLLPNATDVVVDPLGVWSDYSAGTRKRLAQ